MKESLARQETLDKEKQADPTNLDKPIESKKHVPLFGRKRKHNYYGRFTLTQRITYRRM